MLWDAIKENVVKPTGTRIGSMVAGAVVYYGATEPQATAIGVGVTAALTFGIDLMLAWFRKRSIVNTTAAKFGVGDVKNVRGA